MMWTWIRQFLAPPIFEDDEDKTRVAAQLNVILWTFVAIAVLVSLAVPFLFVVQGLPIMAILGGLISLTAVALPLMHRGRVQLAGGLFSLGMWVLYTLLIVGTGGITSPISLAWIVVVIIAGLLSSRRAALGIAGLSAIAGLGILYLEINGRLPLQFITFSPTGGWVLLVAHLGITTALLYLATRGLDDALGRARRSTAELELQRGQLTILVEERTRDLTQRSNYLEAITTIARDVTSELDLQRLLPRLVWSISERFGFYHTGIFLIDPTGEWAELQAASSEAGQRMVARGYRLRVGEEGNVGYVTGQGRSRIALYPVLDTDTDVVYSRDPDLPETRSQATLPLRARGEIIGALDVQSTAPEAVNEEDIAVLQALADQIAVAISNARLFQQVEKSLEVERLTYGELSRQAWQKTLSTQPELGYVSKEQGTSPIHDLWESQMERAVHTGRFAIGDRGDRTLAVPIKVREQTIGVFDARKPEGTGAWTAEEIALLESLANQLGIALDSARLYEDTQHRAAREQLVRQITERMREPLDVDRVLQAAVREIGDALDLTGIKVRIDIGATTKTGQ